MFTEVFTILPLACAISVALFGFFILSNNYKSRMNQLMFGFCFSMFFWQFGTFMMFGTRVDDTQAAVFWDRFVYIGVVFMPSLMHHFSLIFTDNKKQRGLLIVNYILSFLFLIASRSEYFVNDLYIYSWGAHTKAKILHTVFLGYFFLGTGLFFYNVYRYYRVTKDKIIKIQSIYVFLAFAIVIFIGGSAYLYAYGIDTKFPFAYFAGLIFPVLLFYAVSKHHLLGGKMVLTEVLVGSACFVLLTEMFLARSTSELIIRILFALVIAMIGILLIISVRKEIQRREEITELAHSLEKANLRLKELDQQKTEFLSIASHQLRTPLSVLNGYLELLKDGDYGKPTKGMIEVMENMEISNGHLVKLIDNFLDVARIEQGRTKFNFMSVDLCKLIAGVVEELRQRALDKGLKIDWQVKACSTTKVSADEEKIRHVVFNFIDNAIKYSDSGVIKVFMYSEDGGFTIKIKDNGLGFGKVDQANFFQKFYRGENVKGVNVNGTGLGLYVCRKFIEAHNGKIWGHSQGLKKGSEFGFWLPRIQ